MADDNKQQPAAEQLANTAAVADDKPSSTPSAEPPKQQADSSSVQDAPEQGPPKPAADQQDVLEEVLMQAMSLKDDATKAFKEQDINNAASTYELALDIFSQAKFEYRKKNMALYADKITYCEQQMAICYVNLSLCCMRQQKYMSGIKFASDVRFSI